MGNSKNNTKQTAREKAEQIMRMVEVGEYFHQLRTEKMNVSLKVVADKLNLSATYLSEIERGVKMCSDFLIRELCDFYEVDEGVVFQKLGKVPLYILEEVEDSAPLQSLISKIKRDPTLTDDKRYKVYEALHKAYNRLMDEED
jgi:transcriptional regulator with XRE-family HTH domain